jgi:eukaryotic-like serine/threonine-protein kinase
MPAPGGTLAGGRYTLQEHLGAGGMASVWLATDERLHRRVAIKVMADVLADDEDWLARFRREAKAAGSLSHPNIVKVFDFGIDEGRPYIVMAHVPGGSLKARLAEGRPPVAAGLARELLGALAHVHAAGILHRDVKPGNILLDAEGRSHLTDFGIARVHDATTVTQTGMVLGTIRYVAPEVAAGEPATERSDLYSAGCVLRELPGGEEGRLSGLIAELTADDPARRPASAEEALAAVEGGRRGAPTAATRALDTPRPADRPLTTRVMGGSDRVRVSADRVKSSADRAWRSPWFLPAAALAAILLTAILVIAVAADGGGEDRSSAPRAAPESASLEQQLDALDRMIEGAAR